MQDSQRSTSSQTCSIETQILQLLQTHPSLHLLQFIHILFLLQCSKIHKIIATLQPVTNYPRHPLLQPTHHKFSNAPITTTHLWFSNNSCTYSINPSLHCNRSQTAPLQSTNSQNNSYATTQHLHYKIIVLNSQIHAIRNVSLTNSSTAI